MAKRRTFNSFHALKLILQPGSYGDLEVDHYESSNKSVEHGDFAEDVPKIDANPEYETDKDGKLNDEPCAKDGGEEYCFVYIFQSSKKTYSTLLANKKMSVKGRKP